MKKALITGIAGQDGSYLADFLLGKNYKVYGLVKRLNEENNLQRIQSILDKIIIYTGDVSDYETVKKVMEEVEPDEVYHLATKHDLSNSLGNYLAIRATNLDGVYFLLSSIKEFSPNSRFFFASSSKVFGDPQISPQNEETPVCPNSLYGISKAAASSLTKMYREKEGIFACSGILYNHESPRRDPEFLPRKVSMTAARIKLGAADSLCIGDLNARRDWGFAGDYVEAMWLMLQQTQPEDFVIGSGETHTVREFIETAFETFDLDWRKYIAVDPVFVRQPERIEMKADIAKAKTKLDWSPRIQFKELVRMMVKEDLERAR